MPSYGCALILKIGIYNPHLHMRNKGLWTLSKVTHGHVVKKCVNQAAGVCLATKIMLWVCYMHVCLSVSVCAYGICLCACMCLCACVSPRGTDVQTWILCRYSQRLRLMEFS